MKSFKNMTGLLLLMPLMLAMCQKQDDTDPVGISFSAKINEMSTRAVGTAFENGDEISVFACHEASLASSNYAQNVRYRFNNDLFSASSPVTYPRKDAALTFYAVYPYGNYSVPELRFSVDTDQSTHAAYTESDLMTSSTTAKMKEIVELKFSHRLSKVVLNLNSADLSSADVRFIQVYTSLDADIAGNVYKETGRKSDVIAFNASAESFMAILPPQTIPAGSQFAEIRVGDKVYDWVAESDIVLSSGVEHVYTATLNGKSVTISADINSWNGSDETYVDADRNQ